jgi:hypothetical protein
MRLRVLFFLDLKILDDSSSDEVVLNNALEIFRSGGVIPNGLGVDDDDGTPEADAEAVGLAAMDHRFRGAESEFLEAAFEELPGGHAIGRVTAFRFGRGGAEEDVALVVCEIEGFGDRVKIRHGEVGIFKPRKTLKMRNLVGELL